jgi:hypothetical protein
MPEMVCPNCGEIKEYGQKEVVERTLIFKNSECVGSTEDVMLRIGVPRCLKCGRKIKFNRGNNNGRE